MKLTGVSRGVRFAITAKPYNGGTVRSADVTAPGPFRFEVGRMPVSVVAGGSNAPLPNTKITLKEKLADGTLKSIAYGITDAAGLIIFDPPGLGAGRIYVLEALSPWDGSTKRSNEIRDAGGVTFVVGNAPLHVTLLDALSNAPLANLVVERLRALRGRHARSWRRQRTTSSVGTRHLRPRRPRQRPPVRPARQPLQRPDLRQRGPARRRRTSSSRSAR